MARQVILSCERDSSVSAVPFRPKAPTMWLNTLPRFDAPPSFLEGSAMENTTNIKRSTAAEIQQAQQA
jgi:hypothetical protein